MVSPSGPLWALVVAVGIMLGLELLYVWRTHRQHEKDDRMIRGVDDPRMPEHWDEDQVERSRQDFLRIERKRRGR